MQGQTRQTDTINMPGAPFPRAEKKVSDFREAYSDSIVKKLLHYYAEKKNPAKVQLLIAENSEDFKAIQAFEQEQKALSLSGERVQTKLMIAMPLEHDSIKRWTIAIFDYATPSAKPVITYFDSHGSMMRGDFYDAMLMSTGSNDGEHPYYFANYKVREAKDAGVIVVEMARHYMETEEVIPPKDMLIEQSRNVHEIDFAIMQSVSARLAKRDERPVNGGAGSSAEAVGSSEVTAANNSLTPHLAQFTGELTKDRLVDLAFTAAKRGNSEFLHIMLDRKMVNRKAVQVLKTLPGQKEFDQIQKDKRILYKETWLIRIQSRLAETRSEFLNGVVTGNIVIGSNEALISKLDRIIATTVQEMLAEFRSSDEIKSLLKQSPEVAETRVGQFMKLIEHVLQQEKLTGRFSSIDTDLSPQENAENIKAHADASIEEAEAQRIQLGPRNMTIATFEEHWTEQEKAKQQEYTKLISKYISKEGVIRSWEDLPIDHTGLTDAQKLLIYNARLNINIQDAEGNTFLHHAVAGGHLDLVHLLLKLGARADIANSYGETAIKLAHRIGFLACMDIIDPSSITVEAAQNGLGSCITFIKGFKQHIRQFKEATDVILKDIGKEAAPEFHHLAYSLRQLDIAYLEEKLVVIDTLCNTVGKSIYSELPQLMDQLILLSYNISDRLEMMEKAAKRLQTGFEGEAANIKSLMALFNAQRLHLIRAISESISSLHSNPDFIRMYRVAHDLKESAPKMPIGMTAQELLQKTAIAVASANERVLALVKDRERELSVLQARLAEGIAEKEVVQDRVATLSMENASLNRQVHQLEADKVQLVGERNAAVERHDALMDRVTTLLMRFDIMQKPEASAEGLDRDIAQRPIDARVFTKHVPDGAVTGNGMAMSVN